MSVSKSSFRIEAINGWNDVVDNITPDTTAGDIVVKVCEKLGIEKSNCRLFQLWIPDNKVNGVYHPIGNHMARKEFMPKWSGNLIVFKFSMSAVFLQQQERNIKDSKCIELFQMAAQQAVLKGQYIPDTEDETGPIISKLAAFHLVKAFPEKDLDSTEVSKLLKKHASEYISKAVLGQRKEKQWIADVVQEYEILKRNNGRKISKIFNLMYLSIVRRFPQYGALFVDGMLLEEGKRGKQVETPVFAGFNNIGVFVVANGVLSKHLFAENLIRTTNSFDEKKKRRTIISISRKANPSVLTAELLFTGPQNAWIKGLVGANQDIVHAHLENVDKQIKKEKDQIEKEKAKLILQEQEKIKQLEAVLKAEAEAAKAEQELRLKKIREMELAAQAALKQAEENAGKQQSTAEIVLHPTDSSDSSSNALSTEEHEALVQAAVQKAMLAKEEEMKAKLAAQEQEAAQKFAEKAEQLRREQIQASELAQKQEAENAEFLSADSIQAKVAQKAKELAEKMMHEYLAAKEVVSSPVPEPPLTDEVTEEEKERLAAEEDARRFDEEEAKREAEIQEKQQKLLDSKAEAARQRALRIAKLKADISKVRARISDINEGGDGDVEGLDAEDNDDESSRSRSGSSASSPVSEETQNIEAESSPEASVEVVDSISLEESSSPPQGMRRQSSRLLELRKQVLERSASQDSVGSSDFADMELPDDMKKDTSGNSEEETENAETPEDPSSERIDENTPLPNGWIKLENEQGQVFFKNQQTQETSFSHPSLH